MNRLLFCVVVLTFFVLPATSPALVITHQEGRWPKDWPMQFEEFRKTARTIDVGTGIQQHIYEIPIKDRATFERLWPAVLKVRSLGGKMTLYQPNKGQHKHWGSLLSYKGPMIRIYSSSRGLSVATELDLDPTKSIDFEKLIKNGLALRAEAPWPKSVRNEKGELPEFVQSKKDANGKLRWVARDPWKNAGGGFHNRCRVDIDILVDGKVIDLNAFALPQNVKIVDLRFEKPQEATKKETK